MDKNYKGKLQNVPVFIIGNGPSLDDIDLSLIDGYFTIGINRAFYKIDPVILIWQDIELWNTEKKKLKNIKAINYNRFQDKPIDNIYKFKRIGNHYHSTSDTRVLHGTGSTAALAFQLAICLGCNPIVLLGCDCQYRGKKTNFYGRNKFHTENSMQYCQNCLRWIRRISKKINPKITVYNCSDNADLDLLKPISIHHALRKIDNKWRIGSDKYRSILQGVAKLSI